MAAQVFVSYAHRDQQPTNWVERLMLYLTAVRHGGVDAWADTRIEPGTDWRAAIADAIERAAAAILIVGPGFLASEFIDRNELPPLLEAGRTRGLRIFPLVVEYCPYQLSPLGPYQAFNDISKPLEALPLPDQNKVLNDLAIEVNTTSAPPAAAAAAVPRRADSDRDALQTLVRLLGDTLTAFTAQVARRDELVSMIRSRLRTEPLEYEMFFQRYYPLLNDKERFVFAQVRAITDGPIHDGNRRQLALIEEHPTLLDVVPDIVALRQHLVFWLNKYDKVFAVRPDMCVLYTGVEDGVPFPVGIDDTIEAWLASHPE